MGVCCLHDGAASTCCFAELPFIRVLRGQLQGGTTATYKPQGKLTEDRGGYVAKPPAKASDPVAVIVMA
jgi:hypothetical protein